jgi:hypothetical protein
VPNYSTSEKEVEKAQESKKKECNLFYIEKINSGNQVVSVFD